MLLLPFQTQTHRRRHCPPPVPTAAVPAASSPPHCPNHIVPSGFVCRCCYWAVVVVVFCELGRASRRRNPTIPAPEPSSTSIIATASEPITAAPIIAHIVRSRCSEARVGHLRRRAALEFVVVVVVGGALPGGGGGMRRGCSGMRVVVVVVFVVLFVVVVGVLMSLLLLLLALLGGGMRGTL